MGTPESFSAFSYSKMKPDYTENESSQMDYPDESNPTPSDGRCCLMRTSKNYWKNEEADAAADWSRTPWWPCSIFVTPNWFSAPPGSLCLRDHDRTTGETIYCIEEVTTKDMAVNFLSLSAISDITVFVQLRGVRSARTLNRASARCPDVATMRRIFSMRHACACHQTENKID